MLLCVRALKHNGKRIFTLAHPGPSGPERRLVDLRARQIYIHEQFHMSAHGPALPAWMSAHFIKPPASGLSTGQYAAAARSSATASGAAVERAHVQTAINVLAAALRYNEMDPLVGYEAFDMDKDGAVSLDDLVKSADQLNLRLDPAQLEALVAFLDVHRVGSADPDKWVDVMSSADHEAVLRSRGLDADTWTSNQQIVMAAEEDMVLRQVSLPPSPSVPRIQLPQKGASHCKSQCCCIMRQCAPVQPGAAFRFCTCYLRFACCPSIASHPRCFSRARALSVGRSVCACCVCASALVPNSCAALGRFEQPWLLGNDPTKRILRIQEITLNIPDRRNPR